MSLVSEFRHRQPQLHQEAVSLSSDTKQPHSRVSSVQASYQNFNYYFPPHANGWAALTTFPVSGEYLVLILRNSRRVTAPASPPCPSCPCASCPECPVCPSGMEGEHQSNIKWPGPSMFGKMLQIYEQGKVLALKWLQVQWISSQSTTITRSSSSIETCR